MTGLFSLFVAGLAAAGWIPMGPFGGAAAFLAADPHQPGVFLAAANSGLLFRSTDRGDSWQPLRFPAQLRGALHVLAVDPATPGVYYAGMGGAGVAGLWRSADAGQSWQLLEPLRGVEVWSLAFMPGEAGRIAVGAGSGVFLSVDAGATWKRISPASNKELQPVVSLTFDPRNSAVIYAGTTHLPWVTRDGGASWQSNHAGMLDDSDVFSIQVDHENSRRVFATACSGLYASSNAGASWRKLRGAQGASYRTYFITQHPAKANVLYAGTTGGLVKSEDGGASWTQLSPHATRALAFDPANPERILVASDDAGIQRSETGGTRLADANNGFCNRHLTVLAAAPSGLYSSTMYDSSGGLFQLNAAGKWSRQASPAKLPGGQLLALTPVAGAAGKIYAAGFQALASSADAGRTWTPLSEPPGNRLITSLLSHSAAHLLIGTESGLFRRDAAGAWHPIPLAGSSGRIRGLFDLGRNGIAVLGAPGAYHSSDGIRFTPLGAPPQGMEIFGLAAVGDTLLAASSHGLLRSEDKGRTWKLEEKGVQGTVHAICSDPSRPGVAYAAHYGEVYAIEISSGEWKRISPESSAIHSIKALATFSGMPGRVFALTQRQGVFALSTMN